MTAENLLYYGDNLDVLRRHVKDESVDLIYLDPPFNSNATYNVLFSEHSGERAASQIKAFEDTWRWDQSAALAYQETVEQGGRVADALLAFRTFLSQSDVMAYLAMMAPRLVELRRVLKPTGSIYLHCDPTASHYLRMLMDSVFGPEHFLSEIVWKRTSAHSSAMRYGPVHDVILFYSKTDTYVWHEQLGPYEQEYVDAFFTHVDEQGRRWRRTDLTGPGVRHGDSALPWRGFDPTARGRHWQPPSYFYEKYTSLTGIELAQFDLITRLEMLDAAGLVHWPKKSGGMPQGRRLLEDAKGIPLQDVWVDIKPIHNIAAERLGYPTQKPEALLDRIISASSNPGDVVLDPFCGCGTAIAAAQKALRHWIGIDITHLAIGLIKHRLLSAFGYEAKYRVIGEPTDLSGAQEVAENDPFQFQAWALGLCHARHAGSSKKGADKGIDGRLFFHDEGAGSSTKQIIFSIKAGHTGSAHVRELIGVLDREKAQIGVLISLQSPTKDMRSEAASAGYYLSPWGTKHPRIQLLTIAELLRGARVDYPPTQANVTFKRAPRAARPGDEQLGLLEED